MNSKSQNKQPLVTIITPSFNQGQFIKRTIESVLLQDIHDIEYLIFDGGSTDQTISILKSFGDSIQWASEPDRGQAHAVNKGFKMARGEIIGWLNSDDIYFPGILQKVINIVNTHKEIDILYGMADHIDENDQTIEEYYTEEWNYERLKEVCYICQPAVFFRRSIIERFGLLNEKLQYCMDYEYWLRIGRSVPFYYLKEKLAGSRLYTETKTLGSAVPVHQEILNMFKKNFRKIPSQWLFNYAHAAARESKLNREIPQENLKFVKKLIKISLWTSLRMRYYVPRTELKTLLKWHSNAKKQLSKNKRDA
jgi:glycosyltransferase involved in cell wall biosynthesis